MRNSAQAFVEQEAFVGVLAIGLYMYVRMDDEIRRLIGSKAYSASIRQAAMAKGMVTLKDEGAEKVFHGMTTTEELMRITQQEVEI